MLRDEWPFILSEQTKTIINDIKKRHMHTHIEILFKILPLPLKSRKSHTFVRRKNKEFKRWTNKKSKQTNKTINKQCVNFLFLFKQRRAKFSIQYHVL